MLCQEEESKKLNRMFLQPQTPKPCNLKSVRRPKIDSRSKPYPLFTDDTLGKFRPIHSAGASLRCINSYLARTARECFDRALLWRSHAYPCHCDRSGNHQFPSLYRSLNPSWISVGIEEVHQDNHHHHPGRRNVSPRDGFAAKRSVLRIVARQAYQGRHREMARGIILQRRRRRDPLSKLKTERRTRRFFQPARESGRAVLHQRYKEICRGWASCRSSKWHRCRENITFMTA